MTDPTPPPTDPAVLNLRRMALRTAGEVVELRQQLDDLARRVQAAEAGGERAGLEEGKGENG